MLEELLWLKPAERERRIVAAVAAGDVSAEEVDATLRLVTRLDSLRVLDIPPGHVLGSRDHVGEIDDHPRPGSANTPGLPVASGASADLNRSEQPLIGEIPVVPEPVAIDVTPDPEGVPVDPQPAPAEPVSQDRPDGRQASMAAGEVQQLGPLLSRRRRAETRSLRRRVAAAALANETPVTDAPSVEVVPGDGRNPTIDWLRP
jgi:hypothetical protein